MTIQEWIANARKYDGEKALRCSNISCFEGCPFYRSDRNGFLTCSDGNRSVRDFDGDDRKMGEYLFEKYNIANKLDLI